MDYEWKKIRDEFEIEKATLEAAESAVDGDAACSDIPVEHLC